MKSLWVGVLIFVVVMGVGCTKSQPTTPASGAAAESPSVIEEKLVAHGKSVYQTYCISCHNLNPTLDGAVGPALAGSSRELVEARILHGTYPDGYKPKRMTGVMPQFPQLKDEVAALAAFLGSVK